MIHIYTGKGKGKTTASLGLALRALGWGRRVCLIQFMKRGAESGELKSLKKFKNCKCVQFGRKELLTPQKIKPIDYQKAQKGLEYAVKVLKERKADVLILDEINFSLHIGLLQVELVKDLMENCPQGIELILTGRYCPDDIQELADYVSDIKEVKHPYQKGIRCRKGIEF